MITASTFVHKHNSFWNTYFPALESYVRVVNSGAYERFQPGFEGDILPSRSYIISETSFCLSSQKNLKVQSIDEAFCEAKKRLSGLSGVPSDVEPLDEKEKLIVLEWSSSLDHMALLGRPSSNVQYNPEFAGCGLLCKSTGDILNNSNTLIEVKCVDRTFRSSDFRQLLTYVFQAIEGGSSISNIVVLNPRKGILFQEDLKQFVFDTSASDLAELQLRFRASVCMAGVSR